MIRTITHRCRTLLARLKGDRQGVTLVEFGFVAPVLCVLVMGIFFWILDWILGAVTAALAGRGG